MIRAIFAADRADGIGFRGSLPWPHNKFDLQWFKNCTNGGIVVMGRKTWDDPKMPKPLSNRINIVVTNRNDVRRANYATTLEKLPNLLNAYSQDAWIIGGADIFAKTRHMCDEIWISRIQGDYYCDTRLPQYRDTFYISESHQYHEKNLNIEIWKKG